MKIRYSSTRKPRQLLDTMTTSHDERAPTSDSSCTNSIHLVTSSLINLRNDLRLLRIEMIEGKHNRYPTCALMRLSKINDDLDKIEDTVLELGGESHMQEHTLALEHAIVQVLRCRRQIEDCFQENSALDRRKRAREDDAVQETSLGTGDKRRRCNVQPRRREFLTGLQAGHEQRRLWSNITCLR